MAFVFSILAIEKKNFTIKILKYYLDNSICEEDNLYEIFFRDMIYLIKI